MWWLVACASPPEEAAVPVHEEIVAAVAGDPELAAWTATPDRYDLAPSTVRVTGYRVYRLAPAGSAHAPAVLLAERESDGDVQVTSGAVAAVAEMIRSAPELRADEGLPAVVALLSDPAGEVKVVSDPRSVSFASPLAEAAFTAPRWRGDTAELHVVDGAGAVLRWTLTVPERGEARLDVERVGGSK
jgi:hypothetical protein